ncbi:MAG: putative rane-bound dehydrogenase, partial [Phycisphaerales bacterium]|nr:putative rane-bound dehydrogenase [Phycisphaerales bacterium]
MIRTALAIAFVLTAVQTRGADAGPTEPVAPATRPATGGLRVSAPLSPAESAARHRVKPGYALDLVAAEPLVKSPVAFDWGPDGRLWVVEMDDYPYGADGKMKPSGRVRYLQDTDGDGRYDKSVLFAEDLNFPTGVLPWRNGVLVTAAPDLLYLEDTDGDGKADVRRVLYTGFAEGNPQLRVNSPSYGLDGWVYLANGLASKGTVRSVRTGKEVPVSGKDVRVRPDTGDIEAEAGPSQFGRRMADDGDWFGVHNSFPGRHYVLPERYARRNPEATLPPVASDLGLGANPKVYPLTAGQKRYGTAFFAQAGRYTSACGVAPYRDALLFPPGRTTTAAATSPATPTPATPTPATPTPAAVAVDLFVCEPVHNLVQHLVLTPTGSTYAAARAADEQDGEFLASADEWFRPVYAATGPDGGLWVADMYRFMIEHPDWLPADGQADYRPYFRLGADKGRIWRVRPNGAPPRPLPRLDALPTPELVQQLASPAGPRRDLVRAMLAWRNDPAAVSPLATLADGAPDPLTRLHALCALESAGAVTPAVLLPRLADPSPAVRRQAVRLAEPLVAGSQELLAAVLKLTDDPDAKVRLQHALSIGEWPGDVAGRALGTL